MSSSSRVILILLAAALSGCGFTPLYSEASVARQIGGTIDIAPLDGPFGFAMRDRIETRLGPAQNARYILTIATRIEEDERAIRADNSITRFTLDAMSTFTVTPVGQDQAVYRDTARAFTAYSAIASAFATRAAEEDARRRLAEALADQIVLKLSATARDWVE